MKFTSDFLASQSRKQLQTIAKKNGLKANASSADLITSLLLVPVDEECPAQDSLPNSDVIVTDAIVADVIVSDAIVPGAIVSDAVVSDVIVTDAIVADLIVQNFSGQTEEAPRLDSEIVRGSDERGLIVGTRVEFLEGDNLKFGRIEKMNKKTYRVTIDETGSGVLLKHADVRIDRKSVV